MSGCNLLTISNLTLHKKILHLLFIAMLLAALSLSAQNPFIKLYTTADGLPSNKIYEMYQDTKKFIWFATAGGLVRYDGSTFTQYQKKDGLSFHTVYTVQEDASGRIWFRCANGKWNYFFNNKIFNEIDAPFLDSLKLVGAVHHNNDDNMYFYQRDKNKIWVLDIDNKIIRHDLPKGMIVHNISRSSNGAYLICTQVGFIKTKSFSEISNQPSSRDIRFPYDLIIPNSKEIIYERIFYPKTQKWVFVKFVDGVRTDSVEFPQKVRPLRCIEDVNGLLWISTWEQGVICVKDKKIISQIDIMEANAFMEDNEGNIWISAKKGVYKINPGFLNFKHFENNFFNNEGIQLLRSGPGSGVFLSNGKTIYLLKNQTFYSFDDFTERCNQMRILNDNFLIFGNYVLSSIQEGPKTNDLTRKLSFKDYYVGENFSIIAVNKTGTEFSGAIIDYNGTNKDEIGVYSVDKKIKEMHRGLIGDGGIRGIFYDASDNLIVNTKKNIYRIFKDKKIPCEDLSRFKGTLINFPLNLNNSTDLLYSEDDSIYLFNNHKLYNLTLKLTYPIEPRVTRLQYNEPTLFLSNNRNIFRCDNPLNILKQDPVQLHLVDIEFQNIHDILVQNDSLYVASDQGLTIIPETFINKIKTHTPIPYFKSIMVNDTVINCSQKEIILTGKNKIKFNFGSINYSASPVIFSYIIEGLDHEWIIGKETNVVYQNLSKGNYIFKVRARKASTEWSAPIEFKITIKAHFWQHPLFMAGLFILFTTLVFLAILRRKNIQIRRRELDNQLISLEQKALQSMMNPHFIFNSLGSIQNYILQEKSIEAGLYLSQFARLIRQNLNAINASAINLEEEIDRLKNYLDLERLRTGNKFEYELEVDEKIESEAIFIPSMIVQPFAENSIWHGIAPLKKAGKIIIKFRLLSEKALRIIIEDNGIGMKQSASHSIKTEKHLNLGMEMTRKRLELLGKKLNIATGIEFCEAIPGNVHPGTKVVLVVPVSCSEAGF